MVAVGVVNVRVDLTLVVARCFPRHTLLRCGHGYVLNRGGCDHVIASFQHFAAAHVKVGIDKSHRGPDRSDVQAGTDDGAKLAQPL